MTFSISKSDFEQAQSPYPQPVFGTFFSSAERSTSSGDSGHIYNHGQRSLLVYLDITAVGKPVASTAIGGGGGSGYTSATATYDDGQGHTDTGTVTLLVGSVTAVVPDHATTTYTATPTVTITGDGTGATATATLDTVSSTLTLTIMEKTPQGNERTLLTGTALSTINASGSPRLYQITPLLATSANAIAQAVLPYEMYAKCVNSSATNPLTYSLMFEMLP